MPATAAAASADAAVIVGVGALANGYEASRWTASGGMVGLLPLARDRGDFFNTARLDWAYIGDADGTPITLDGTRN